jgi:hypothetical protein
MTAGPDLSIDPDLIEGILEERAAAAKKKRKHRAHDGDDESDDDARYIHVPLSFVRDVCLLTEGRNALAVALCIYRRARIHRSRTVTLPGADLVELDRSAPQARGADSVASVGLIKVTTRTGRSARITLLWQQS